MIVVITAPGYEDTLDSLTKGEFGFPIPHLVLNDYDSLFCQPRLPRATYIFADLERLAPWKLRVAAKVFRLLTEQGLRCLNDPARVMCRLELLQTLCASGFNPFNVIRADERPKPVRFPVFLRYEDNHAELLSPLLHNQHELDTELVKLRAAGLPLRGILAVEFCAEPYSNGLWHKWGSFRVGGHMSVDHIAIDDNWLVKLGVWEKLTEAAITDEHEAVKCNRYAEALKPVFDVAGIDYGRADHATINGRTVVYEINTNPYIGRYVPDPNPLRRETQILARQRFADALDAIDTTGQGTVTINHGAGANQPRNEKPSWWRRSQLDVIRSSRVQARGAEHLRELENELEAKKSELNARGAQVKKLEAELLRKTRAFEEESKAVTSELKASGARVKRLEAELVKSKKETARLKAQLSALCTSRSWRITAPLRFVSQLVQRHVRREKDVTAANP